MILVSVFDKKAGTYSPPVAFEHVWAAMRAYSRLPQDRPDALLCKFPEDYDLYQVGEFDETSGGIVPVTPPHFLEFLVNVFNQSKKKEV